MVAGLHHVSVLSGAPQRTVDFYAGTLGLRPVKRTVNFDDPGTHHIYFGDRVGTPGTVLSVFPCGDGREGAVGTGQATTTALTVPPNSLSAWRDRIAESTGAVGAPRERFGTEVLPVRDPDGGRLELVAAGIPAGVEPSTAIVDESMAIGGLYGVTIDSREPAGIVDLFDAFGFERVDASGDRTRLRGDADVGAVVDIVDTDADHGRPGPGTVHHVALRAADNAALASARDRLRTFGRQPTEVEDRQYFRSLYARTADGVLLEVATDEPGFTVDEPQDELAEELVLPPWLESERDRIRLNLRELTFPDTDPHATL